MLELGFAELVETGRNDGLRYRRRLGGRRSWQHVHYCDLMRERQMKHSCFERELDLPISFQFDGTFFWITDACFERVHLELILYLTLNV